MKKKSQINYARMFIIFTAVAILCVGVLSHYMKLVKYYFIDNNGTKVYFVKSVYFKIPKKKDSDVFDNKIAYVDSIMSNDTATNKVVTLYCKYYQTDATEILKAVPLLGSKVGESCIRDVTSKNGSTSKDQWLTILAIKN